MNGFGLNTKTIKQQPWREEEKNGLSNAVSAARLRGDLRGCISCRQQGRRACHRPIASNECVALRPGERTEQMLHCPLSAFSAAIGGKSSSRQALRRSRAVCSSGIARVIWHGRSEGMSGCGRLQRMPYVR